MMYDVAYGLIFLTKIIQFDLLLKVRCFTMCRNHTSLR